MTDITNNSSMKPATETVVRPFCVLFVHPATPKAICAETVMAAGVDDATLRVAEKHRESTIVHVRRIGAHTANSGDKSADSGPQCSDRHSPPPNTFPGARFINGEFHAASYREEAELDAISD